MATWSLSPQYKKNAIEKMFFFKEGKIITIEQGYRWATFKVDSNVRPLTDEELKNEDGYELAAIENDESWEMWDMTDGCYLEIDTGNDLATDEDVEEFEAAWEEDSFEGVEALGWQNDDTEYYYYGPLELTNEDTGEVFKGEPDDVPEVPVGLTVEEKVELVNELEAEVRAEQAEGAKWPFSPPVPEVPEPELTDWFDAAKTCPERKGNYQVIDKECPNWPFPSYAIWSGKKWDNKNVVQWRGLAQEPK